MDFTPKNLRKSQKIQFSQFAFFEKSALMGKTGKWAIGYGGYTADIVNWIVNIFHYCTINIMCVNWIVDILNYYNIIKIFLLYFGVKPKYRIGVCLPYIRLMFVVKPKYHNGVCPPYVCRMSAVCSPYVRRTSAICPPYVCVCPPYVRRMSAVYLLYLIAHFPGKTCFQKFRAWYPRSLKLIPLEGYKHSLTLYSCSRISLETQKSMLINGATVTNLRMPEKSDINRNDDVSVRRKALLLLKARTPQRILYSSCGCKIFK